MAEWKNIYINTNLIQNFTSKSYLFKLPNNSKYAGYLFWHPAKCVHSVYGRDDILSLGYTDDFTFKIFKQGKNFNRLDEINLTAKDIEEIFENMDANIRPWIKNKWCEKKEIDIIHTPEIMQPIENPVADKDLIDD